MRFFKNSAHLIAMFFTYACFSSFACVGLATQSSQTLLPTSGNVSTQNAIGDVVDKLGDNLMLVHQDSKSQWWFATWGDGLYRYDGKGIVHFTTKHGLSHNRTDQIVEDSAGNLYFNTMEGVSRFDGKAFYTLPLSLVPEWKLMPGNLWFKFPKIGGSVYRFDGRMLHALQLPRVKIGEDYVSKNPTAPSPYDVTFVYRDKRENVWFGTAALGVCYYDGKSFHWLTSDDVNELHNGPSGGVRSIIEDHEGKFWFNTRFRYTINQPPFAPVNSAQSEAIFQRLPGIGSLDGKPDGEHEYMSIAQDREKNLWIATYRNGAYRYDGKTLRHYPILNGSKDVNLFTIYCDRDGTIWVGTPEDGVYRFNGTSFERFANGPS